MHVILNCSTIIFKNWIKFPIYNSIFYFMLAYFKYATIVSCKKLPCQMSVCFLCSSGYNALKMAPLKLLLRQMHCQNSWLCSSLSLALNIVDIWLLASTQVVAKQLIFSDNFGRSKIKICLQIYLSVYPMVCAGFTTESVFLRYTMIW